MSSPGLPQTFVAQLGHVYFVFESRRPSDYDHASGQSRGVCELVFDFDLRQGSGPIKGAKGPRSQSACSRSRAGMVLSRKSYIIASSSMSLHQWRFIR